IDWPGVAGNLRPCTPPQLDMRVLPFGSSAVALAACLVGSAGCEMIVAGPRVEAGDVWERTYELGDTPSVDIANTNGAVTVEAYDGSTVEVHAERSVKAGSEDSAQRLLEATIIAEEVT